MNTIKWNDIPNENQEFLKKNYPKIAMDLIFGLPVDVSLKEAIEVAKTEITGTGDQR